MITELGYCNLMRGNLKISTKGILSLKRKMIVMYRTEAFTWGPGPQKRYLVVDGVIDCKEETESDSK